MDLKSSRISVGVHTLTGILAGYLSFSVNNTLLSFGLAMGLLLFSALLSQQLVGKKDLKWLVGNGLFIYIFVWLITWIFLFNL